LEIVAEKTKRLGVGVGGTQRHGEWREERSEGIGLPETSIETDSEGKGVAFKGNKSQV